MNAFDQQRELTPMIAMEITDGQWVNGAPAVIGPVTYDSRILVPGEIFVALRAARDGHEFVEAAKERGAIAAIVDQPVDCDLPQLVVKDTMRSLRDLAHWHRAAFEGSVIFITGSSGKSTTKEMLKSILTRFAGEDAVLATVGNHNNQIGLPITFTHLRPSHVFAVVEAGMNHPGEIARLARLSRPTLGVITNAGRAHLGHFDNEEDIASAKGELLGTMQRDFPIILNVDDQFYPLWCSMAAHLDVLGFSHVGQRTAACRRIPDRDFLFSFTGSNQVVEISLQVPGRHNEMNALAAVTAAWRLGVPTEVIREGLEEFSGVPGRQEISSHDGIVVINDSYNASPESFFEAVAGLQARPETNKILVMGDMLELGERALDLHVLVINKAHESGISHILAFGEHSVAATKIAGGIGYASKGQLVDAARRLVHANSAILIKGSRSMHMEEVAQALVGA